MCTMYNEQWKLFKQTHEVEIRSCILLEYNTLTIVCTEGEDQKLSDKYTGFTINNKMTNDPSQREMEYYHCFENFTTKRNKPGMIHVYQNKIIHYRRYNMY